MRRPGHARPLRVAPRHGRHVHRRGASGGGCGRSRGKADLGSLGDRPLRLSGLPLDRRRGRAVLQPCCAIAEVVLLDASQRGAGRLLRTARLRLLSRALPLPWQGAAAARHGPYRRLRAARGGSPVRMCRCSAAVPDERTARTAARVLGASGPRPASPSLRVAFVIDGRSSVFVRFAIRFSVDARAVDPGGEAPWDSKLPSKRAPWTTPEPPRPGTAAGWWWRARSTSSATCGRGGSRDGGRSPAAHGPPPTAR